MGKPKVKILFYCLGGRWDIGPSLLYMLRNEEFFNVYNREFYYYYAFNKSRITPLIKKINIVKPDYIFGLAGFRKDSKNIRAEQEYFNKYGKHSIILDGKKSYLSSIPIKEEGILKKTYNAGNGPCNLSSYMIMHNISQLDLKSKFVLLHIPKNYQKELALDVILSIIINLIK